MEFPTLRVQSEVFSEQRALAFAQLPDVLGLIAWMHRDLLIKRLDTLIDAESDPGAALSHGDREIRTAEVMGDLLSVEFQESFFVWEAQAQNLPIEHRGDINPVALLGVRLVTAARVNETPGTTPGYSWPMRR